MEKIRIVDLTNEKDKIEVKEVNEVSCILTSLLEIYKYKLY